MSIIRWVHISSQSQRIDVLDMLQCFSIMNTHGRLSVGVCVGVRVSEEKR